MKRSLRVSGAILFGMLAISLALYWAADAGSRGLQILFLSVLGALALFAVWYWK